MKHILAICLVLCLLVTLVPSSAQAAAEYGVVKGGWLRLRASASFNARTIASYYTGTTVTILGSSGSWRYVKTPDGLLGYMHGNYLVLGGDVGESTVQSANGLGVCMRTGPGTGYRVIAVYNVGTPVTVLEYGAAWCRIKVGSLTGYMMTQFIKVGGGVPVPPTGLYATIWSPNIYGVRLRKGPGTGYGVIGTYAAGTVVTVIEKGAVWSKISVNNVVGHMMNMYLDFSNKVPVPTTYALTQVTLNNENPKVGDVLYAQTIAPVGATVSYRWLVGGKDVVGGSSFAYTVTQSDLGKRIELQLTGTGSYTGTVTSPKTQAVVAAPTGLTPVTGVFISNTSPKVGDVLYAQNIAPAGASVSYRWLVGGKDVSNGSASAYTVTQNDVGARIEVLVTGTGNYTGTVASAKTDAVAAVQPVLISVTGVSLSNLSPKVGDTLTAQNITPAGATVSYRWLVGGSDVSNGASASYTVTQNDLGKRVEVMITGTGSYTGTVASAKTDAVVNNQPALIPVTGVTLSNLNPTVGDTLTAQNITPAGATVSYRWLVGGKDVNNGASASYTVTQDDAGKRIEVLVIGTGGYTGTVGSGETGAVADNQPALTPITGVSIDISTPQVGNTLTAIPEPVGATVAYSWLVGGKYVDGETNSSYTVRDGDLDKRIEVRVTGTGTYTGEAFSAKTDRVTAP